MSVLRVYATATDYQSTTGDMFTTPAKINLLLVEASRNVDRAVIGAKYVTDPQGYPADASLIDAFMQAACQQAAFLRDLDDPTGAKARMNNVKVGSLSFTRTPGTAGMALKPLGPQALEILQLAQVISIAPYNNW